MLGNPVNLRDPDGRSSTCETCPDEERFDSYRNDPLVDYTYTPNEGGGGEIHVSDRQQVGEVTVTAEEYGTTPADNTSVSVNQVDPNASGSMFSENAQEYGQQMWGEATRDAFQIPDAKRQGDPIEMFKLYDFWGDVYNEAVKEILGWFGVNDGNSPRPTPPGTPPVAPVPEVSQPAPSNREVYYEDYYFGDSKDSLMNRYYYSQGVDGNSSYDSVRYNYHQKNNYKKDAR